MKNYPKVTILVTDTNELEWLQSVFIEAAHLIENRTQDYICYAINMFQPRILHTKVKRMTDSEREEYRTRRKAVLQALWIVRDALSPNMSFIEWMRKNNTDAPDVKVNSLGMTTITYEGALRAKLELYRPHRLEWLDQILSIINMKL